jgi:AraC family transcriptional regulator
MMDTQRKSGFSHHVGADLPIELFRAEAGTTARLPPHQLQSAVADISRALNEAMRKNGINAMLYLRRTEGSLTPEVRREISRTAIAGPRLTAWQQRRVLEHIESSLSTSLRNRELAALVGFSEFHFNVAFRNTLGISPHEFPMRRRIERAQHFMLSSRMPLCEIAAECGLADQAHLSRLFRKFIGETPAAWRKSRFTGEAASSGGAPHRSVARPLGSDRRIQRAM